MIISNPSHMVLLSLFFSVLLIVLYFIYRYIYPKKSISYPILILFISTMPLVSMLRSGGYESGDLNIHVAFAIPFFENLKNGIFFPVWNQYVIGGYGYPLYLFLYPLPYYLSSFIHLFGLSFIDSFKIILVFSFILSGQGMYLLVKDVTGNKKAGFISALFYLFAPYHLIDMHFRVAIGETLSFALLPFCFLYLRKMTSSFSRQNFILFASFLSLLIISHQAIALASFPFLLIYSLFLIKRKKDLSKIIFTFLLPIGITAFYWIPLLYSSRFTYLLNGRIEFSSLSSLFYSPYLFGFLFQGHSGELALIVGYLHLLVLLVFIAFLFKNKINPVFKKFGLFLLISTLFLLFMITPASESVWKNIFLLKGFQFSYRLLVLVNLFTSILAGLTLVNIQNKIFVKFLLMIVVFSSILNWGNRKALSSVNDETIRKSLYSSLDSVGQGKTVWNNVKLKKRTDNINIIKGDTTINEISRKQTNHKYFINVISNEALLTDNTTYFPGWNINADSINLPINNKNGLINFKLKKGDHSVSVYYKETRINRIARVFSFTVIIFMILIVSFSRKKKILK